MKNQMMQVKIGDYGSFLIGHKNLMGKVDQVINMGNDILEEKNGRKMTLDQILSSNDFWLFIIELEAKRIKVSHDSLEGLKVDYSTLKEYQEKDGKIRYSKLIKMFPNQIRVQKRGKIENIGTWMNLHALLKVASYMDKALEVEIYDVFITGNILQFRDDGGESYKALNAAIDTLPDRSIEMKPKGNKGVYIQISKLIRQKLEIVNTFGYNEDDHNLFVQDMRNKIHEMMVQSIDLGFITSYPQLKDTIMRFNIVKK